MNTIRCVIIGFAHMHVNEISNYILSQNGMELVGCADVPALMAEGTDKRYTRTWNLKNVSTQHGLVAHADYQAMLDQLTPDMAFILCENVKKPDVVEQCARRGINVCIEKPMAVSLFAAREIAQSVRKHGIEAVINWPTTWRPHIQQLKAALDRGVCGRLLKIYYINGHTGPLGIGARHRGVDAQAEAMTDEERARTWWYQEKQGGGAFLDIGCYGCMYSAWLQAEEARAISATCANLGTPYSDACDNLTAIIEYPSALSVIEGTWTMPQKALPSGPILCCEHGMLYVTDTLQVVAMDLRGDITQIDKAPLKTYANICEQYMDYKENGAPLDVTVTLCQNLKMMALLDTAMRAAQSGKRESVPCQM